MEHFVLGFINLMFLLTFCFSLLFLLPKLAYNLFHRDAFTRVIKLYFCFIIFLNLLILHPNHNSFGQVSPFNLG